MSCDAFGTGVEYPIDDIRCGIVWDKGTHTYALMLAVGFWPRNPRWQHLQIWTNVARMELQPNKWGNPRQTNYFANFRKESEYQDGKFPNAQIFNQEELRVQRMEQRKLDSTKTREDFMREARDMKELEVVTTTLQSPEWIDSEIEGEGTAASSSVGPLGAPTAEQAAVPEPMPSEEMPTLFVDERDPYIMSTHGDGIDFGRFRRESKAWPHWYKNVAKSLVDHYPKCKWFDKTKLNLAWNIDA